jgi:hypothetical protein
VIGNYRKTWSQPVTAQRLHVGGILGGIASLESTLEGEDERIPLADSLLLDSASRINDRIPSKQNVEGVELDACRRGSVFEDRVSESGEQAGLRAGLTGGDVVAPADGGSVAELGVPDDEVAEDAAGAVGIECFAAPAKGDTHLAPVVGREGGVGEGVVVVPDGELVEPIIVVGGVDLHHLDVGVGEIESAARSGSVAGGPSEPYFVAAPGRADDAGVGEACRLRQPVVAIFRRGRERPVGPVVHADIAPGVRSRVLIPVKDLERAIVLVPGPICFVAGVLCNVAGVGVSGVSPVGVAEIDRAGRGDFRQGNPNDDPTSSRRRCPTVADVVDTDVQEVVAHRHIRVIQPVDRDGQGGIGGGGDDAEGVGGQIPVGPRGALAAGDGLGAGRGDAQAVLAVGPAVELHQPDESIDAGDVLHDLVAAETAIRRVVEDGGRVDGSECASPID